MNKWLKYLLVTMLMCCSGGAGFWAGARHGARNAENEHLAFRVMFGLSKVTQLNEGQVDRAKDELNLDMLMCYHELQTRGVPPTGALLRNKRLIEYQIEDYTNSLNAASWGAGTNLVNDSNQ